MTSLFEIVINLNYILFTKLPWPGDSKRNFRSSSQAATCPPHTMVASHCFFLLLKSSKETVNTNFILFGLTRSGIETESTVAAVGALSTRLLIG